MLFCNVSTAKLQSIDTEILNLLRSFTKGMLWTTMHNQQDPLQLSAKFGWACSALEAGTFLTHELMPLQPIRPSLNDTV